MLPLPSVLLLLMLLAYLTRLWAAMLLLRMLRCSWRRLSLLLLLLLLLSLGVLLPLHVVMLLL